jgi:predicted nucleic acid-binding protein
VIVADASAIVDLLVGVDKVRGEVADVLRNHAPVDAPDLLTLEVVSAVTRIGRAGGLSRTEVETVVGAYAQLPIERHVTHPYWPRILTLSGRLSAYDAAYVAVAEALGAPLVTTDRRLARSVTTVDVIVI